MRKAVRAIVVKDESLLVMHRNKFGHEYYALIGGGVDHGESAEQALHREIMEETGIVVTNPRLVVIEDAGDVYGMQYIYLCDYASGEPKLDPASAEAEIHSMGDNLYTPMWVALSELPKIQLLPAELKLIVIEHLEKGFSDEPIMLTIPD